MEKAKKNLKVTAICIIAVTLVKLITSIITFAINGVEVPENMITPEITKDAAYAVMVISWALSLAFNLPSFYVGLKGLKVAKNPDNSKGHIVWAVILLVFAVIAALSCVSQLSSAKDMTTAVLETVSVVCSVVLYFIFVMEAKKVRPAA